MTEPPKDPEQKEKDDNLAQTVRLVSASHLAYFLPAAVIIGALVGRWVGGKFGHPDGGTLVGLLWGCASGVWEIIKVQKGLNRKG
jgi:F0F1-type ATP synthase assembly protein I